MFCIGIAVAMEDFAILDSMKHCENCGTIMETRKKGVEWYCTKCAKHSYANPIPAIDAMLFDENGRILLGRRSTEPSKGRLNLPGGFVDPNETFEEAIARELHEELGLDQTSFGKLTYAGSRVDYYTSEGTERQLLVVLMYGDIDHQTFEGSDEVSEYIWLMPTEIKQDELTNASEYRHIMEAVSVR